MINEADASGNGRIDYAEFAHLWKISLLQRHHKPVAGRLQQVMESQSRVLRMRLIRFDLTSLLFAQ